MALVTIHREDDTNEKEQLETLTLSLKSIEGSENNLFAAIQSSINNANAQLTSVANSLQRLRNLSKNLNDATLALIKIEQSGMNNTKQGNKIIAAAHDYKYPLNCNTCQSCNTCQGCNHCDDCNYCNSCNVCNGSCQTRDGGCDNCNNCNYCQSCNSCQTCNSSCDDCNSCQGCNSGCQSQF